MFTKTNTNMKKALYISGFLASFLISFGITSKHMYWPYANMEIFAGLLFLTFLFIPLFFADKWKSLPQ